MKPGAVDRPINIEATRQTDGADPDSEGLSGADLSYADVTNTKLWTDLSEAILDHGGQFGHHRFGIIACHDDFDRVTLGRTQHHQAQYRAAGCFVVTLGNANGARVREFGDRVDEFGAGPCMQAPLVDDLD